MGANDPLLKIRLDGTTVGPGEIPVSALMRLLSNLTKAFQRTGRVLAGASDSVRRGQVPQNISAETDLNLVLLTHGSPATVLGFERKNTTNQDNMSLLHHDFGLEVMEKSIRGLESVQSSAKDLPVGYDAGVLMAWRDVGALLNHGTDKINFALNGRETSAAADLTQNGLEKIQARIQGPKINVRTIEGRLLMADFKEHGTRCRVHPSAGQPILCLFDDDKQDVVLENILQFVRVVGEAKQDPVSDKITSIKIHDIQKLDNREQDDVHLLPLGAPISYNFWDSPTLEELARQQNVKPMTDLRKILGTWPGDLDDGFEDDVDQLRHPRRHTRKGLS